MTSRIKAVLFDKDGTLIDFHASWGPVCRMASALAAYDRHRELFVEFSPINHVTADDPPLFLSYGRDTSLPAKNAGHAIHHPQLGIELKKRSDVVGHECHLAIAGVSKSDTYADAEHLGIADVIATEPELVDGVFSGGTTGVLNMRSGKVTRLHDWLAQRGRRLAQFDSTAYSDSINDLPLLEAANHAVAVHADARLAAIAAARGWRTMNLSGTTPGATGTP